ncbi:MAG: VOC family protein [Pseudomonadota bacterium]
MTRWNSTLCLLTLALAITLALAMTWALPLAAAPVPEEDRLPIDLRRTTLVVRDIDASLKFYRDALGMKVIYDRDIRNPRDAASDEESTLARRLVFLRANDDYVGVLGLLQYRKPRKPALHQGLEPFTPGSSVLLFNAADLDSTFEKAASTLGVRVLSQPTLTTYPGYNGGPAIDVKVSVLTDPDGFVIELNQVMSELR